MITLMSCYEKIQNSRSVTPMANSRKHRGTRLFLPMEKKTAHVLSELVSTAESAVFFSLLQYSCTHFQEFIQVTRPELHSFRYFHTRGSTRLGCKPKYSVHSGSSIQTEQNDPIFLSRLSNAMIKCDKDFFRSKLLRNAYNMKIKKESTL